MGFFRRREPLHERLAREGGLTPPDPRSPWQETGIHGIQRAREWDVTLSAGQDAADGSRVTFVALPDRSLLIEDGDVEDASGLADRVDSELPAPYRARAARVGLWMIQARRIQVVELPDEPEGETIDVTPDGLLVDGERRFGSMPALEGLGDVVHAERLDGDLWEVRANRL